MKILFTSVGRRVELMQVFRNTAQKLNEKLTIIGADNTDTVPGLIFCDESKMVCKIDNPEYILQLLSICEKEHVDYLIPTIETDVHVLVESKKDFEEIGTKVLISNADKVRICRDKCFTADYFTSLGLKALLPFDSAEKYLKANSDGFPAFIKPKDGSSSIDTYKVNNIDDLNAYVRKIKNHIIQNYIESREYIVDIFATMRAIQCLSHQEKG